jgi:hypothetical protein
MPRAPADMPLYPSEDQIAVAVMGPARAKEWPGKARYLQDKHGLPPVDELMGGRYWPAVEEFFRARHGVALPKTVDGPAIVPTISSRVRVVPFKPDGRENYDVEETQAATGRRPSGRDHRARL